MSREEVVVGAAVALVLLLAAWRVVLQLRLVRLFLRRLFGQEQLRRPASAAGQGKGAPGNGSGTRQPVGARQSAMAGFEFLRV